MIFPFHVNEGVLTKDLNSKAHFAFVESHTLKSWHPLQIKKESTVLHLICHSSLLPPLLLWRRRAGEHWTWVKESLQAFTHTSPIYVTHTNAPTPLTATASLLHSKPFYWLACALLWNSQQPLGISSHWLHNQSVTESRPIRRGFLQSGERGRGCGWLSDNMQWGGRGGGQSGVDLHILGVHAWSRPAARQGSRLKSSPG